MSNSNTTDLAPPIKPPAISILLIEDSEDDYFFTCRLLKKIQSEQTFNLFWKTNFEDGYEACQTNTYDILLIDYKLDNRDGLELTESLNPKDINTPPIIILTGGKSIYLELKAIKLGASDCLFKHQLTPQLLERAIYYSIERKKSDNELTKHREHLEDLIKERTQELTLSRDEANRANTAKSDFLSNMSHELRTPLNAILGFSQLLEIESNQNLTDEQSDNINEISKAGNHLLSLVNDLLDLNKIENNKLTLTLESVSINSAIEDSVSHLQPLATKRGIDFNLNLNSDLFIKADQTRLKQILINLISNAIKFNRENGNIKINCKTIDQYIRISVEDTGHGISTELLPKLFQSFVRLDSPSNLLEGTGIGLSLAKKLVETMKGKIGVESTSKQGSTFWFDLPLST